MQGAITCGWLSNRLDSSNAAAILADFAGPIPGTASHSTGLASRMADKSPSYGCSNVLARSRALCLWLPV